MCMPRVYACNYFSRRVARRFRPDPQGRSTRAISLKRLWAQLSIEPSMRVRDVFARYATVECIITRASAALRMHLGKEDKKERSDLHVRQASES